jgi:hypothetical protein
MLFDEAIIEASGVSAPDRAGITDTITRYCTAVDFKQWDLMDALWAQECRCAFGDLMLENKADILEWMDQAHLFITASTHRVSNIDVLACDGKTASVRYYLHAILVSEGREGGESLHVAGYSHDSMIFENGRWKLVDKVWTTTWSEGNFGVMNFGSESADQIKDSTRGIPAPRGVS